MWDLAVLITRPFVCIHTLHDIWRHAGMVHNITYGINTTYMQAYSVCHAGM